MLDGRGFAVDAIELLGLNRESVRNVRSIRDVFFPDFPEAFSFSCFTLQGILSSLHSAPQLIYAARYAVISDGSFVVSVAFPGRQLVRS